MSISSSYDSNDLRTEIAINGSCVPPIRKWLSDDEVRDVLNPLWRLYLYPAVMTGGSNDDELGDATKVVNGDTIPLPPSMHKKNQIIVRQCLKKTYKDVRGAYRLRDALALREAKHKNDGTPPILLPHPEWLVSRRIDWRQITPSPRLSFYRNKCEMTCGRSFSSPDAPDDSAVSSSGFKPLGWSGSVANPNPCFAVPSSFCAVNKAFAAFLRTSPFAVYDMIKHAGVWRQITMRESKRTGGLMIVIQHADGELLDKALWESEKVRLLDIFLGSGGVPPLSKGERCLPPPPSSGIFSGEDYAEDEGREEPYRVTSLYLQLYTGLSVPNADHPFQLLGGETTLIEKVFDLSFRVSPGAFFQVNTAGAERLFDIVVEEVKRDDSAPAPSLDSVDHLVVTPRRHTNLFDVCCGTGVIGLICLSRGACDRVFGVDIAPSAIADALINRELNGYGDDVVSFVCDKAEKAMKKDIRKAMNTVGSEYARFVAVVDPARGGLHPDALKAIRACPKIEKVVYVSCNPTKSLPNDAVVLCGPNSNTNIGGAFEITRVHGVDMFPLTPHCECIMVFERNSRIESRLVNKPNGE